MEVKGWVLIIMNNQIAPLFGSLKTYAGRLHAHKVLDPSIPS